LRPLKILINRIEKMQVIENATVICRSMGEKNICIVQNENTGVEIALQNGKGIELELGMEGRFIYNELSSNQLVSFEPVMAEELVF
jgi:hypothetical protein